MIPTLQSGDRIAVVPISEVSSPIKRGAVVVFRTPAVFSCASEVMEIVKRVIGLPGETISREFGPIPGSLLVGEVEAVVTRNGQGVSIPVTPG